MTGVGGIDILAVVETSDDEETEGEPDVNGERETRGDADGRAESDADGVSDAEKEPLPDMLGETDSVL